MADDVIFEKEDRVKVTSGKLKGKKGYVRYVGTVASKDDMIFVGVELDEPNGKHDGKVKGKRYFKCRDKHGYMAPHETFELFGKSKKKLLNRKPKLKPSKSSNKSSKSTKNTKSKLLNKSTSSPPFSTKDSASKIKGKKKKKKKDVLNDSKKDLLSVKMPTLHGDNISPSKSPTPIITQITYSDVSTQTDMRRLHIVNDDNDIASVSKEVAEAHANMIESLRNQISKLNTEILQLKGNNLKLENDILNKNDLIEILTIEKESQNEEILDLKQEINENKILVENLELDIDELKDDQNNIRLSIVEELEYGSKNINDILQQNAELKATMDILKKNALSEITCKNSDILQLAMKCKGIPSLKKHISELESQLELKSNIENECIEFKRELDLRSNTDSIIEILSTKNVELEYEIKRLNEVNKHFENMDNIFNEIEKENEQYIFDLNEELKCKELIIIELNTKLNKLNKELRHSQNTVFQFKDHIHKLEETKRKINLSFNNNKKGNKDLKLEKEILLRCNLELLERINNIKKELIKYSNIASHGISNSIENEILISHIPHTIKCDYGSIKCLGFLGRILFKNKFCFSILNSFYIQDNKVGNEIIRENDIKDIYKVIELCPILIKQYRFINCIYLGLLDIGCHESEIDKFNDAINEWSQLLEIENKYNKLLLCISNNNIRSGNISISDIFKCNDLFRQYINKHFAIFSPEIKHREKEIIDKWELYIQLQSIKYNLYNMKLKTNEINDIIISENENENENQRICIVGVLTKIEELQIIIMEIVQRSLKFCKPAECNIFHNNQTLPIKTIKKLQDENYIGIQFNFIDNFSILMRSLITKQNLLIENLHTTFQQTELTHFDRIGKINRLLDEQSEVSQNGIVCGLEKLYKHIKSLPYQLEQLIPDENIILKPPNNDSININIVPTVWNKKASIIREELGEADIIRDGLESAQAEIKSKQKELMLEKSNTGQIKSRLEVVKLELAKQRTINRDLIHYELEAKDSETKLIKYIDKNKLLKNQNNKLIGTKTELENQLNSYQNTLKSMKLKSSKRKIKNLHDDNSIGIGIGHDDKIGHHKRGHSLTNMHSIHHSLSHKPLNGKLTGHLSLGDGSNSFDLMDTNGEQNNQFVISQLHKELDLNKKYNKLLQKTVNSLRHNYNIYNLHKQYIQMKKDLKPLPNFNSINQMQYKKYCQKKQFLIDKKKQKNLLIEKERNKLLSQPVKSKSKSKSKEKEKDQNINDNDNDDCKMEINDILSSYKQKEIKQNRYKNIQKSLTNLDKQFGEIYSFPNIIDLTNQNINYKQQIIARNMKLRDIKLKCSKLTKEYKEIQSNFEHNNNIHHNSSHDNHITPTHNNVSILGRIDIEGLKNTNYQINKTKVCLNRNNVIKLQNYLNVLC